MAFMYAEWHVADQWSKHHTGFSTHKLRVPWSICKHSNTCRWLCKGVAFYHALPRLPKLAVAVQPGSAHASTSQCMPDATKACW